MCFAYIRITNRQHVGNLSAAERTHLCMNGQVCVCVRAGVRACVRARVCVRACVRVCVKD